MRFKKKNSRELFNLRKSSSHERSQKEIEKGIVGYKAKKKSQPLMVNMKDLC